MFLKILIGVAIVLVVLAIIIQLQPAAFRIERSTTIAAPPQAVFEQVNDFHAWGGWSPWEKMDPQLKRTYEGPTSGTGAVYSWAGNSKVGEGRMTIQKSEQPSLISIKLEFLKPFAATNTATFTFTPVAGGTKVVWAMEGEKNFPCKAFGLFMNMDKMCGDDFERGLAAMKTLAESQSKATAEVPQLVGQN
jgi:uncharacterized protein YndB with AHSA1/START domain